jgi:recombination protein RecR
MSSLEPLERVAAALRRLPGVGRRSAERMAYALASGGAALARDLRAALGDMESQLALCSTCGNLTLKTDNPCRICSDARRDDRLICVVQDPADIVLVEKAGSFRGRYHVLRGVLSPGQGSGMAETGIEALLARVSHGGVTEVILALNADVESDATASFLREALTRLGTKVSMLARGLPAGSGLVYTDHVTLARAIEERRSL